MTGASGASRQKPSTNSRRRSRDMTRRTRGISLHQLIEDLRPYLIGWRRYFGFCQTHVCSLTWKRGSAEDCVPIFGNGGRTGPNRFKELRSRGVPKFNAGGRRRLTDGILAYVRTPGGQHALRKHSSTYSICPDPMSLLTLSPMEPPWYRPVCAVVWEGWHREVSPYPDQSSY
jgi:hypothetical protein